MSEKPGQEWEDNKNDLEDVGALGDIPDAFWREYPEVSDDKDLQDVLGILQKESPELFKKIFVHVGDVFEDVVLKGTPAIFGPDKDMGYGPRIAISPELKDEKKWFEIVSETRKISIDLIKEKLVKELGIKFSNLNSKILKIFILLHEFGHGDEYFKKYKTDRAISYRDAKGKRLEDLNKAMKELPVPGVNIGFARYAWQEAKGDIDVMKKMLREYRKRHFPSTLESPDNDKFDEIKFDENLGRYSSVEEMLDDHERQEKGGVIEQYADSFAVDFLQKHWEELGLDKE